ncbi:MAG: DUF4469 domain-containing protein, partial [Treponema sp.]|nr:DUF4469 domain-containing protein [Treponema sp.]
MLDYYLKRNSIPLDSTDHHAVVTHTEGVDDEGFIKLLSEVLNINEGEAWRVLSGVETVARNLLSQGWSFKLAKICSFSLGISGSFPTPDASFDPAVNKVTVRIHVDKNLLAAARTAPLNRLHGVENGPIIDSITDKATGKINSILTPGHGVQLSGKNLKVVGEGAGVFLVADTGDIIPVPANDLLENVSTKSLFICPAL